MLLYLHRVSTQLERDSRSKNHDDSDVSSESKSGRSSLGDNKDDDDHLGRQDKTNTATADTAITTAATTAIALSTTAIGMYFSSLLFYMDLHYNIVTHHWL